MAHVPAAGDLVTSPASSDKLGFGCLAIVVALVATVALSLFGIVTYPGP